MFVNINELKKNIRYKEIMPLPSKDDYEALKNSIKKYGIKIPIVVNKNYEIIDGYSRYSVAKEIGLKEIPCRILSFGNKFEEEEYIILANLHRRHLNNAQKADIGLKLLEIEKERARERQKIAGKLYGEKHPKEEVVPKSEQPLETGKAIEIVAKKVGVGKDTLWKAKKIKEKAEENENVKKLWDKAISGKKTINAVYKKVLESERPATPSMPKDKYNVIYADPPWKYEFSVSSTRAIETKYSTLTTDEICNIIPPATNDAILFLWTPAPKLEDGLKVMKVWGFSYKTNMVWVKDKIGMGYYFRSKHELLLVGIKGDFKPPKEDRRFPSVLEASREEHSKKPEKMYEIIENMYPNGKYLEMFARNRRKGWASWGVEV